MFQRQIDEGSTLERAMYMSKTSTPQDHINAFGNRDNWRTWTGGNKMGIGGAAVNAARRAQKANRDARKAARDNPFSIPSLGLDNVMMAVNAGPSSPIRYYGGPGPKGFFHYTGAGRPGKITPKGITIPNF